jgi:hypothetical protein
MHIKRGTALVFVLVLGVAFMVWAQGPVLQGTTKSPQAPTIQQPGTIPTLADCQYFNPNHIGILDCPHKDCWEAGGRRAVADISSNPPIVLWEYYSKIIAGVSDPQFNKVADIIRYYKMNNICFIGRSTSRPFGFMVYFTMGDNKAPQGAYTGEDVISFNPKNLKAVNEGGRWKLSDGQNTFLDFGSYTDSTGSTYAMQAIKVIQYYGFTYLCFVGRTYDEFNDPPFMYFRK